MVSEIAKKASEKEIREELRIAAIKNALEFGRAREGALIGRLISKFPELKSRMKEISAMAKEAVDEINGMSAAEIKKASKKYEKLFEEEKRKKTEESAEARLELKGVSGSFATRFPPEPSGYMHIGHAKVAFMEQRFAQMYGGKLFLYFDDTNPEKEKQEFVDAMKRDLAWLGIGFGREYYASDNIESLYGYARRLIESGSAYVCLCDAAKLKESRLRMIGCEHRKQDAPENMHLWKEMLGRKFKENEAVLRLKAEIDSKNTAMRDPTLFRVKYSLHYRQGGRYAVWPTYSFNTPIVDSLNGVSDVIRSKEYEMTDELYYRILDLLSMVKPRIHSVARLEIANNMTSKRKLNELIKQGKIHGYDDPRLVTITALRRRGILPEAIKRLALRFGMSKTESAVSINMLLAENRKLIDPAAKRLFFVEKPFMLTVSGIPERMRNISMKLHPSTDLGYRKYKLNDRFFINTADALKLKEGTRVALKDAFSVRIEKLGDGKAEGTYMKENAEERIQWVNEGNYVECSIEVIGDLLKGEAFNDESIKVSKGYAESFAANLDDGEVVQFERVGFFKVDDKNAMLFISL